MIPLILAAALLAQSRVKAPGEDWVSLFNGKDLTGWVNIGQEKWEIENGTIHGVAVTKAYGYLQTEKSYKDFQLALRFKCEGDGNSGVFFHVWFKAGTADVTTPGKKTKGLNELSALEPRALRARWMTRNSSWIRG